MSERLCMGNSWCKHPATWTVTMHYADGDTETLKYCRYHVPNPKCLPFGAMTRERLPKVSERGQS